MVSVFRLPHTLLNESFRLQFPFVFRRLQSLQLLLPARPCFLFQLSLSFLASLGFHFHGLAPLPLLFLTPAVFAPFRSLQFWVLTTQPLCFLSLFFLSPPHSGFLSAPISLSLLRFSPFFPAWFPVHSFPVPVLSIAVCFLSPFLASLPQLFHECLPSFPLSLLFRHFPHPVSLSFVRSSFASGYSALCFFLSVLPGSASQRLPRCPLSAFASWASPFSPA